MRKLKIATVSFAIAEKIDSVQENLDRAREYVRQAAELGAHIVCLPETVTTFHTSDPMLAEHYPGDWTKFFQHAAIEHSIAIIAPYFVRESGHQFNQATIIASDGEIVGNYRKLQPTGREVKTVTPGNVLPVFQLRFPKGGPVVKIAIMICMDIYFPEISRIYAMKGCEVLFWPTITHGPTQSGLEAQARVRAMDNSMILVESNLSQEPPYAPYLNRFYPGTARIIDHNGDIIATTGRRPGVVVAELDLDEARKTLDCFLIEEVDQTRNDIESLARMDLYAKEYEALAKRQKRYYETITRTK